MEKKLINIDEIMVEKIKEKNREEEQLDFSLNASDLTEITLTEKESEKVIEMLNRGPNEKARKFTEEALKFYEASARKSQIKKEK